jgi:hypothetical protein
LQSKDDTRQTWHTADCLPCPTRHTAEMGPTPGEQQTPKSLYSAVHALKHTVDTLPCPAGTGTRQTSSAAAFTAVTTLPCVCTRQMVCRVQIRIYRANGRHGRGLFSCSDRPCSTACRARATSSQNTAPLVDSSSPSSCLARQASFAVRLSPVYVSARHAGVSPRRAMAYPYPADK